MCESCNFAFVLSVSKVNKISKRHFIEASLPRKSVDISICEYFDAIIEGFFSYHCGFEELKLCLVEGDLGSLFNCQFIISLIPFFPDVANACILSQ